MTSRRLSVVVAALVAAAELPPPGALACAGCHPPDHFLATPVPVIAGQSEEAILAKLRAFKSGERPATVMDRIAKGIGEDEARAIARWYSRLEAK
jgi:sulfide dehydrogenase cytochrome subunit